MRNPPAAQLVVILLLVCGLLLSSGSRSALAATALSKGQFFGIVRQYIASAKPVGEASKYFALADAGVLVSKVDSWLVGVAVDPDYIQSLNWRTKPMSDVAAGYTQTKSMWDAAATRNEARYNGWIILKEDPASGEGPNTSLHESIHAFHLAIGSNADEDASKGPENIATQLKKVINNVNRIERNVAEWQKDTSKRAQLKPIIYGDLKREQQTVSKFTPQTYECLRNIGGKCQWNDYVASVERRIGPEEPWMNILGHWTKGAWRLQFMLLKDGKAEGVLRSVPASHAKMLKQGVVLCKPGVGSGDSITCTSLAFPQPEDFPKVQFDPRGYPTKVVYKPATDAISIEYAAHKYDPETGKWHYDKKSQVVLSFQRYVEEF